MTNEYIIESLKNGEKTVSQIEDELVEEAREQELDSTKEDIAHLFRCCDNLFELIVKEVTRNFCQAKTNRTLYIAVIAQGIALILLTVAFLLS